eukprot:753314-Hanusia_phi.AAC.3
MSERAAGRGRRGEAADLEALEEYDKLEEHPQVIQLLLPRAQQLKREFLQDESEEEGGGGRSEPGADGGRRLRSAAGDHHKLHHKTLATCRIGSSSASCACFCCMVTAQASSSARQSGWAGADGRRG